MLSNREILQNLYKRINIKKPKQPKSDAPLENLEKYQKEIDEFPAKREEHIRKEPEKEMKTLSASLKEKSEDELYKMYVSLNAVRSTPRIIYKTLLTYIL